MPLVCCRHAQSRRPRVGYGFKQCAFVCRVWASIGWGGLSAVAGALLSRTSLRYGILVYLIMCIPNVLMAWLLNPGPKKAQPKKLPSAAARPEQGMADGQGTQV